jgi:hypothetical protein
VGTASFKTSIKSTGPFFQGDPAKTFAGNVHEMMLALAREGRADVVGQLEQGQGGRPVIRLLKDRVADHVVGELRRAPPGSRYSAVIFIRNKKFTKAEATSLMAAASRLEGSIHAFRKTAGRLMRSRAANAEELIKGLV